MANVSFHKLSKSAFAARVNTSTAAQKLELGGLYFVYDDTDTTQGLLYQVTAVASTEPYAATTVVYGHVGLSQSTGTNADLGKVPLLNSSGKLDNSFFQFINDGKIVDSYISTLYLNEFKGTFTDAGDLTDLTTSSVDDQSAPRDINVGDWVLVSGDQTSITNDGPYICKSIDGSGSTWQHIANPLGELVTDFTSPSNSKVPTAQAVKTYVDNAIAGGALTWSDT